MRLRTLALIALAGGLSAPAVVAAQDTAKKPVTVGQVAKNTEKESKRVANRTGKTVRKAGKDTEKQTKRAAKSVKKVYSRKARKEAKGDTVKTKTP